MCWSATVSLNTYIVATFGTIFALANGAPVGVVAWLHVFSMMQLAEFFIWRNLHDLYWNRVFSWFGLLLLAIEPIASILLMTPGALQTGMMLTYLAYIAIMGIFYIPTQPYSSIAPNGHLQWNWVDSKRPLPLKIIWIIFFILPLFLSKHYFLGIATTISLIISIIAFRKGGTWGSMWCWIANTVWLFIIGFVALNKCFGKTLCTKKDGVVKRA